MGLLFLLGIVIFFVVVFKHLKKDGETNYVVKPQSEPPRPPVKNVKAPEIEQPKAPVKRHTRYFGYKDNGFGYTTYWPLDQLIGDYIEFDIAGINFRRGLRDYVGEYKGTLQADPKNRHDKNAIKVLAPDGKHLGFVPRDMTDEVREFCELPCDCYCLVRRIEDEDNKYYLGQAYITKTPPKEE